jgi:hypothetical protein
MKSAPRLRCFDVFIAGEYFGRFLAVNKTMLIWRIASIVSAEWLSIAAQTLQVQGRHA